MAPADNFAGDIYRKIVRTCFFSLKRKPLEAISIA